MQSWPHLFIDYVNLLYPTNNFELARSEHSLNVLDLTSKLHLQPKVHNNIGPALCHDISKKNSK